MSGAELEIARQIESVAKALQNLAWSVSDDDVSLADVLSRLASHMKWLGNGDAAGPMGAIEHLAVCIKEAGEHVAMSIDGLAEAIRERDE